MKKKILFVAMPFVVFCIVLVIYSFSVVNVDENDKGTAKYIYGDKNIVSEISNEDMNNIVEILDGKRIDHLILPACGFDENVAIIIDNKTLCIACDACGFIYFKERIGYINLEDDENKKNSFNFRELRLFLALCLIILVAYIENLNSRQYF